jgi:hypothetical protein
MYREMVQITVTNAVRFKIQKSSVFPPVLYVLPEQIGPPKGKSMLFYIPHHVLLLQFVCKA